MSKPSKDTKESHVAVTAIEDRPRSWSRWFRKRGCLHKSPWSGSYVARDIPPAYISWDPVMGKYYIPNQGGSRPFMGGYRSHGAPIRGDYSSNESDSDERIRNHEKEKIENWGERTGPEIYAGAPPRGYLYRVEGLSPTKMKELRKPTKINLSICQPPKQAESQGGFRSMYNFLGGQNTSTPDMDDLNSLYPEAHGGPGLAMPPSPPAFHQSIQMDRSMVDMSSSLNQMTDWILPDCSTEISDSEAPRIPSPMHHFTKKLGLFEGIDHVIELSPTTTQENTLLTYSPNEVTKSYTELSPPNLMSTSGPTHSPPTNASKWQITKQTRRHLGDMATNPIFKDRLGKKDNGIVDFQ